VPIAIGAERRQLQASMRRSLSQRSTNSRTRGAPSASRSLPDFTAAEARSGTDQPIGLALPVDRAAPVRAVVRRLHPASAVMLGAPSLAVALYVTDPRKPIETPEEVLQRLFGLTGREARCCGFWRKAGICGPRRRTSLSVTRRYAAMSNT
jgi:hypothetical protein